MGSSGIAEVAAAVHGLGGLVERRLLLRFVSRRDLEAALAAGQVVALGRSRCTLPGLLGDRAEAERLGGALCLTSAALARGWSVAATPRRPHVVVPRNRSVEPRRRGRSEVHRWDAVVEDGVTSAEQTVLDCATRLPLLEAVAVGDSAVRSGQTSREALLRAAEASPRSGRSRRVAVVQQVDGRAANPFESAVRVLASDVPGLALEPQLHLPGYGYPDLRDPARRVLVECDSFRYHHDRLALVRDTERYNTAAVLGHTILRFAFEHPFLRPDYVTGTLRSWVAAQDAAHAERSGPCRRCA